MYAGEEKKIFLFCKRRNLEGKICKSSSLVFGHIYIYYILLCMLVKKFERNIKPGL